MDNIWRYVYCPLRLLAWKAATKVLQLLSATLGVVQGLHRILYCLPPSVFCLPLLPLPSGVQSRVMRVMLLGSSLSMCPIHLHFLAVFMTRVLGHKILRIFSRRMCTVFAKHIKFLTSFIIVIYLVFGLAILLHSTTVIIFFWHSQKMAFTFCVVEISPLTWSTDLLQQNRCNGLSSS